MITPLGSCKNAHSGEIIRDRALQRSGINGQHDGRLRQHCTAQKAAGANQIVNHSHGRVLKLETRKVCFAGGIWLYIACVENVNERSE
jgi:hypothetical protein